MTMKVDENINKWSFDVGETKKHVEDNKHLYGSKSLSKIMSKNTTGADGKPLEGAAYIGRVFKNLGDVLHVKFARLMHRFSEGHWVTNKTVRQDLNNKVDDLTKAIKGNQINEEDKAVIERGVAEMQAVCALLKSRGVKDIDSISKKLETILKGQTVIAKDLEKQIARQRAKPERKRGVEEQRGRSRSREAHVEERSGSPSKGHVPTDARAYYAESKSQLKEFKKERIVREKAAETPVLKKIKSGSQTTDDIEVHKPKVSQEGRAKDGTGMSVPAWRARHEHQKAEAEGFPSTIKDTMARGEELQHLRKANKGYVRTKAKELDKKRSQKDIGKVSIDKGFEEKIKKAEEHKKRLFSEYPQTEHAKVGAQKVSPKLAQDIKRGYDKQRMEELFGKRVPSHEEMVKVVKNRLNYLIENAQKDEEFTKTLGKWRGLASRENKTLESMLKMLFTPKVDHESVIKEGLSLIRKGYGDSIPEEVQSDIRELNDCLAYMRKLNIQQKAEEFDKQNPSTRRKERAVEDLPSLKHSIVHADQEVPEVGSVPIERKDAAKDREYLKAINQKKDLLRKNLEAFIDAALLDPEFSKSLSNEEKLQLSSLIQGNVRDMSRHNMKHGFKTAKNLIKSKYKPTPDFVKNFGQSAKKVLADLKSLELERARHREKTGLAMGQAEKGIIERRKEKNLERFEENYEATDMERPWEYEDTVWGSNKEMLEAKAKDDMAASGMDSFEDITDPQLVNADIKRDMRYILKQLQNDESAFSGLGKMWGEEPHEHTRLRELAGLSYDKMSDKELIKHLREAVTLVEERYSGKIPPHVQKRVDKLEVFLDHYEK